MLISLKVPVLFASAEFGLV